MNTLYEDSARHRQRQQLAESASRRLAYRVSAAQRWQRAETWVARRRVRAERATREASDVDCS